MLFRHLLSKTSHSRPSTLNSIYRSSRLHTSSNNVPPPISQYPPIRYRSPITWSLAAVVAIYFGCATYEVRQNIGKLETPLSVNTAWEEVERARVSSVVRQHIARQSRGEPSIGDLRSPNAIVETWNHLLSPEKFMWSVIGLNTGLFGLATYSPHVQLALEHVPALNKNWTLFGSMFGHVNLFHLGFNMYALHSFTQPVAMSPTFEVSGSHLTAFYLSAGVLSSLAHHLASGWPQRHMRRIPCLGASGAIFAMLGAFAMSYPDAGVGIILLPFTVPASQAIIGMAAIDLYGLFIGIRFLPFAHAAHLAGLACGSAYVYFNGRDNIWGPMRRLAFRILRPKPSIT
jgi:rhomboid-like protein